MQFYPFLILHIGKSKQAFKLDRFSLYTDTDSAKDTGGKSEEERWK